MSSKYRLDIWPAEKMRFRCFNESLYCKRKYFKGTGYSTYDFYEYYLKRGMMFRDISYNAFQKDLTMFNWVLI